MKSIKINNMPDLPYAMEEAVNRLRINISFLGTKIKKIMILMKTTIKKIIILKIMMENKKIQIRKIKMFNKYNIRI